jgi:hypothetical protein
MKKTIGVVVPAVLLAAAVHAKEPPSHVYPHRSQGARAAAAATVGSNPKHWGGGTTYNPSGFYHRYPVDTKARAADRARRNSPAAKRQREKHLHAARMRVKTKAEVSRIKERISLYKRYPNSYHAGVIKQLKGELEAARKEANKYDKREPARSPTFHYTP